VIVASTVGAYGRHDTLPYHEDFALNGAHPYDVSKSCADLIAHTYHHTYGTPVSITRCGNVYGAGDLNWSRVVPGTIRSLYLGERPIIRSDGTPTRDYLHASDAVEGTLQLAERMDDESIRGQAFNLGSGQPISVLELTRRLGRLMERTDLEPDVRNEAKAEIPHQYLSAELARKDLGWKPAARLDERLAQTVRWYVDYLSANRERQGRQDKQDR
jgi:CDP-glucose 4,6-dehydratase